MGKSTNHFQSEQMIKFMSENIWLAMGQSKDEETGRTNKKAWVELAEILNELGPPRRDARVWSKVWRDLKYNIRQKVMKINAELAKSDDEVVKPISLSPSEEAVVSLLGINNLCSKFRRARATSICQAEVTPIESQSQLELEPVDFEDMNEPNDTTIDCEVQINEMNYEDYAEAAPEPAENSSMPKKRKYEKQTHLLVKQIKLQEESKAYFHEFCSQSLQVQKDISSYLGALTQIEERKLKILEKKAEEKIKFQQETIALRKEEFQLKLRQISLEEAKLKP